MNYEDLADFYSAFVPFGTLDIQEALERGQDILGLTAEQVGELVKEKADEFCYENIEDIDCVAMVNDEIRSSAVSNWNDLTSKIDWENVSYENHESGEDELTDALEDIYFFANYIDCPLIYEEDKHGEAVKFFAQLVEDDLIDKDEIKEPLKFVLSKMGYDVEG